MQYASLDAPLDAVMKEANDEPDAPPERPPATAGFQSGRGIAQSARKLSGPNAGSSAAGGGGSGTGGLRLPGGTACGREPPCLFDRGAPCAWNLSITEAVFLSAYLLVTSQSVEPSLCL